MDINSFNIIRNTGTYQFLRDKLFLPRGVAIALTPIVIASIAILITGTVIAVIFFVSKAFEGTQKQRDESRRRYQQEHPQTPPPAHRNAPYPSR